MEVPDVIVVAKADLGAAARRALADLRAALRSLDAASTAVVAVSSIRPPTGIDELIEALDGHRASLDLPFRRLRARRMQALADFVAEHGERGLRALGGQRAAERYLGEQDPRLDVPALTRALEERVVMQNERPQPPTS
jgi:LAO/AO transport system kinase